MIPRYAKMARTQIAIENCVKSDNQEWLEKHRNTLSSLFETAPHGSGIDGENILLRISNKQIKIEIDFHHMNENGFYDGWTKHTITISPSLAFGIDMKISGQNRGDIKDYLHDRFHSWATELVEEFN